MSATASAEPRSIAYRRPWLYAAQAAAIFHPARYVVIEASTKAGKTAGCLAWIVELAVLTGRPGRNYWWVAPVYAQARIAYRRLKRGLPRAMFRLNDGEMTITLLNGAVIWFKSAEDPDNLFGEDVYGAVMDEATRAREEAWFAVRSTLTATEGPVRIIGNVKGRRNWAYRMARRAEAGAANMHYARLTAWDAVAGGVLSAGEIEDARETLPDHVWRELYLAEASDDGSNPFGLTAIEACLIEAPSGAPAIAAGWDLARKRDWTVGIGLDANGNVAWAERWNEGALLPTMSGEYWAATIARIQATTDATPALVDATGLGDPVFAQIAGGRGNYAPFVFSARSKQQIMEGLAVAIQRGDIGIPQGMIADELREMEFVHTRTGVRYGAPEGLHDDAVMALALAVSLYTAPPVYDGIMTLADDEMVTIGPRY